MTGGAWIYAHTQAEDREPDTWGDGRRPIDPIEQVGRYWRETYKCEEARYKVIQEVEATNRLLRPSDERCRACR